MTSPTSPCSVSDGPRERTGQLDDRLRRLDVDEGLVEHDDVADRHLPRDDLGLDEALADVGQEEDLLAQLSNPITRSTASRIRSTLGR